MKTLKTLVKKGANINFQHKAFGGRTALHAACDSGESSAAVALVELKCDLELKDRNGNLPIECAGECTPPYTLQFPSTNPLMCARDNIDFLFLMRINFLFSFFSKTFREERTQRSYSYARFALVWLNMREKNDDVRLDRDFD